MCFDWNKHITASVVYSNDYKTLSSCLSVPLAKDSICLLGWSGMKRTHFAIVCALQNDLSVSSL